MCIYLTRVANSLQKFLATVATVLQHKIVLDHGSHLSNNENETIMVLIYSSLSNH